MKKYGIFTAFLMSIVLMCGCSPKKQETVLIPSNIMSIPAESDAQYVANAESSDTKIGGEQERKHEIVLSVNGEELSVSWENNSSVDALQELLQEGNIIVSMKPYGGFEQVGSLPQYIVSDDMSFTTFPGDIVLYSGNAIVLFYGTNSWSYTKLGHIEGLSVDELEALLNRDKVIAELSVTEQVNGT